MIDYHKEVVDALSMIADTHYEMVLHSGIETPCISYMELNNYDDATGDTFGYSRLSYQIKVWGNDIGVIQRYAKEVDVVMRGLGFHRVSGGELYDNNSTMIQKIMTYEALAYETY